MDHFSSALLALHRDHSNDLAFSALPDAPRREPASPGPLRRAVSRGLVRTARRVEPGIAVTGEPATQRSV
jgi:hypothetical protein